MADIKSIQIDGVTYNVKDETARQELLDKSNLDESGHVAQSESSPCVLLKVDDSSLDEWNPEVGDCFFDTGKIWYYAGDNNLIDLGSASKTMIYCHKSTGQLYRWTGSTMQAIGGSGSSATVANEILNL